VRAWTKNLEEELAKQQKNETGADQESQVTVVEIRCKKKIKKRQNTKASLNVVRRRVLLKPRKRREKRNPGTLTERSNDQKRGTEEGGEDFGVKQERNKHRAESRLEKMEKKKKGEAPPCLSVIHKPYSLETRKGEGADEKQEMTQRKGSGTSPPSRNSSNSV